LMADAGEIIYSLLKGSSAVTNIVSLRIYPNVIPASVQNKLTLPAIMFQKLADTQWHVMGADDTPLKVSYTVHCYATSFSDGVNLRDAVISTLKDYSGTVSGTQVQRIFYENSYDLYDSETGLHDLVADFVVAMERTT